MSLQKDLSLQRQESLPSLQKQLLEKYVAAVMAAPASLGLTAAKEPAEFWERHVLDALKILTLMPQKLHHDKIAALDVGSGNGIPGVPVAIALPQWSVCLLDSNNKKAGFLDMFCKFNAIKNARVLAGRAETLAHDGEFRERFDLVTARALGKLPAALELCLPFLKPGGLLAIPHGDSYKSELAKSKKALEEIGGIYRDAIPYQLNERITFHCLLFQKNHETPARYPRKPGLPHKRPL